MKTLVAAQPESISLGVVSVHLEPHKENGCPVLLGGILVVIAHRHILLYLGRNLFGFSTILACYTSTPTPNPNDGSAFESTRLIQYL